MTLADPIADMLIRIKNASAVKKETVLVPYSKLKLELARLLAERGYVSLVERRGRKGRKFIELALAYQADGSGLITDLRRISKPSRRVYRQAKEIRKVKGGLGISIISTSQGLKSDKEARRLHLGGEIICEIW